MARRAGAVRSKGHFSNEELERELARLDGLREKVLAGSRETIKLCAQAIHGLHQGKDVEGLVAQARALAERAARDASEMPSEHVPHGSLLQAQQELVECLIVRAYYKNEGAPGPDDIGVGAIAYLYGLSDAVGELRRITVQALLDRDLPRARRTLAAMDGMFNVLMAVGEYGVASNLKHKRDAARSSLERTRSDVMAASLKLDDSTAPDGEG